MSWEMTANSGQGGGQERPPAGNHCAVLVAVVDMGTQEEEFQGQQKDQRKVYLCWELVAKKIAGTTKNHVIGCVLTYSMNEKAKLRKWIEARRGTRIADGQTVNIIEELGKPCFLNVVMNNSGYPRIDGVASVPEGIPIPSPTYPVTAISLEEFRSGTKTIPEWIPWLYGSPLDEHIRACHEIGGRRPTPRSGGKQESHEDPFTPATSTSDEAPF